MRFPGYQARPQQMMAVLERLQARWPLDNPPLPTNLALLFEALAAMRPAAVSAFALRLTRSELKLLGTGYAQAPNVRALTMVALVMAHRRDPRLGEILYALYHRLPGTQEIEWLHGELCALNLQQTVRGAHFWLYRHLFEHPKQSVLDYVTQGLADGSLAFTTVFAQDQVKTPLLQGVLLWLFKEGNPVLASLKPHTAAQMVRPFVDAGDMGPVANYLNYYPSEQWPYELIALTAEKFGDPDEKGGAFYRKVETGRLWAFRRLLFRDKVLKSSMLDLQQQDLWERWLHRCQQWRELDGRIEIVVRPFKVVMSTRETLFFQADAPDHQVDQMRHDGNWSAKVEALLRKYIKWGLAP